MQLLNFLSPLLIALVSFQISGFIFPLIIKRSYRKKFFKRSNHRTSHNGNVSSLGGIGIFIGFFIAINFGMFIHYQDTEITRGLYALLFPMLIVFLLGLWDDLKELKALEKIFLELLAAFLLLVLNPNLLISGFDGLFGLNQVPDWMALALGVFMIFLIINATNLLDGIDGLVGGYLSLVVIWMFLIYNSIGSDIGQITSCALFGALILFLYYNLLHKRKLFMGDSGSLILGLLLAYFSFDVLSIIQSNKLPEFTHGFSWAFMLLSLPLIDTTRVVFIRIFTGKNILSADRNHIHHRYLKMGLTHSQTTSVLLISTIALWTLGFLLMGYFSNIVHLIVVIIISIILYLGPILISELFKK